VRVVTHHRNRVLHLLAWRLPVCLCLVCAFLPVAVRSAPPRKAFLKTMPLATFDLTSIDWYDLHTKSGKNNAWAEARCVAALQGIVNRNQPRLYITYVSDDPQRPGWIDRFWLTHLRAPGGWLADRPLRPISTLEGLIQTFHFEIQGVVLYDLRVPATSNVASTAAGCEDLLPIRYDRVRLLIVMPHHHGLGNNIPRRWYLTKSIRTPYDLRPGSVYDRMVVHGPRLPIKLRLVNADGTSLFQGKETGSAKCDVLPDDGSRPSEWRSD
jgi:hypothetical protein